VVSLAITLLPFGLIFVPVYSSLTPPGQYLPAGITVETVINGVGLAVFLVIGAFHLSTLALVVSFIQTVSAKN